MEWRMLMNTQLKNDVRPDEIINILAGDTFKPVVLCSMPDQPVRQEENKQKAVLQRKFRESYQGLTFGEDVETSKIVNNAYNEKVKVKSRKIGE